MQQRTPLREAGFSEKQSKTLLTVIEQQHLTKHHMEQLDTKLDKFQLEVKYEFQEIRRDMQELGTNLRHEMKELETNLRHQMKELGTSLILKLGGFMVLLFTLFSGFLSAVIKFTH